MSNLFESIKQGLNEAVEYERGNLQNVKVDRISIAPLHTYTSAEIKAIRVRHCMSQRVFAEAMGVSAKTIEAWESGRNTPSGIANRMFAFLEKDEKLFENFSVVTQR